MPQNAFKPLTLLLWTALVASAGASSAYAQVEDPALASTTPAEAALTQWPDSGDRPFDSAPAQAIRFKPASERTEIGKATRDLLQMQREAQSAHPRDIDGAQASRSYNRYLKSFETDIPAQFTTGIDTGVRK